MVCPAPWVSAQLPHLCVQLVPEQSVRTLEHLNMFDLGVGEGSQWSYSLPVRGGEGEMLEVCLSKWWASLGGLEIELSICLQGAGLVGQQAMVRRRVLTLARRNPKIIEPSSSFPPLT